MVKFLDIQQITASFEPELSNAIDRVVRSGWFILGEEVSEFEKEYAEFIGSKHCIGVANGLDARHLIVRGYGIGAGDEVIVPANTFIATWLAVSHCGAVPVPVEPDETTYALDPDRIAAAVTNRTRAIIAVHLYGHPARMDRICSIARERGLRVIEDAAQAHGARWMGRRTGSLADAAAFSFYPSKNLGAYGDGGAVVSEDRNLMERILAMRNYGGISKHRHDVCGYNSRLDPLQAAFLRVRLRHLDAWNARREAVAQAYREGLSGISRCAIPVTAAEAVHAWHLYVIRHPERDKLRNSLAAKGVETAIHYPSPPHLTPAYAGLGWRRGDLPIAERLADTVLSLPMGPHLDANSVKQVIDAIAVAEKNID